VVRLDRECLQNFVPPSNETATRLVMITPLKASAWRQELKGFKSIHHDEGWQGVNEPRKVSLIKLKESSKLAVRLSSFHITNIPPQQPFTVDSNKGCWWKKKLCYLVFDSRLQGETVYLNHSRVDEPSTALANDHNLFTISSNKLSSALINPKAINDEYLWYRVGSLIHSLAAANW
jgi:hypothetical protein